VQRLAYTIVCDEGATQRDSLETGFSLPWKYNASAGMTTALHSVRFTIDKTLLSHPNREESCRNSI
jgi:hypothetical protein